MVRIVVLLLVSLFFAIGAAAQDSAARDRAAPAGRRGPVAPAADSASSAASIGPDQAAAIARAQTGGRVLDVQRVPDGGKPAYAVRLLLDAGRVRTVVVDGQSGRLR